MSNCNNSTIYIPASSDAGQVQIFEWDDINNDWKLLGNIIDGTNDTDMSGWSVKMSENGNCIAIGSPFNDTTFIEAGQVRIFEYSLIETEWKQKGNIIYGQNSNELFGKSISLSNDGSIIAVGLVKKIRIYQYNTITNLYEQIGNEIIFDYQDLNVQLSSDGLILAIGIPKDNNRGIRIGNVQVYQYTSQLDKWQKLGQNMFGSMTDDNFGHSLDISGDGKRIIIGSPFNNELGEDAGKIDIYNLQDTTNKYVINKTLSQLGYLYSENPLDFDNNDYEFIVTIVERNNRENGRFVLIENPVFFNSKVNLVGGLGGTVWQSDFTNVSRVKYASYNLDPNNPNITNTPLQIDGNPNRVDKTYFYFHQRIRITVINRILRYYIINRNGQDEFEVDFGENMQPVIPENTPLYIAFIDNGTTNINEPNRKNNYKVDFQINNLNNNPFTFTINPNTLNTTKEDVLWEKDINIFPIQINNILEQDQFGWATSISDNGNYIAVGAKQNNVGRGYVRIYEYQLGVGNNTIVQRGQNIEGDTNGDISGWSVKISNDGNYVIIGAIQTRNIPSADSGYVRVYKYDSNNNEWLKEGNNINGERTADKFGFSIDGSFNNNNKYIIIGAPEHDTVESSLQQDIDELDKYINPQNDEDRLITFCSRIVVYNIEFKQSLADTNLHFKLAIRDRLYEYLTNITQLENLPTTNEFVKQYNCALENSLLIDRLKWLFLAISGTINIELEQSEFITKENCKQFENIIFKELIEFFKNRLFENRSDITSPGEYNVKVIEFIYTVLQRLCPQEIINGTKNQVLVNDKKYCEELYTYFTDLIKERIIFIKVNDVKVAVKKNEIELYYVKDFIYDLIERLTYYLPIIPIKVEQTGFQIDIDDLIKFINLIKNYFPDYFVEQRKIVRNIVIYYIRLARQQLDVKTIFRALLTIITVFPDLQLPEIFIKEILYDQGFSQLDIDKRRWGNKKINILKLDNLGNMNTNDFKRFHNQYYAPLKKNDKTTIQTSTNKLIVERVDANTYNVEIDGNISTFGPDEKFIFNGIEWIIGGLSTVVNKTLTMNDMTSLFFDTFDKNNDNIFTTFEKDDFQDINNQYLNFIVDELVKEINFIYIDKGFDKLDANADRELLFNLLNTTMLNEFFLSFTLPINSSSYIAAISSEFETLYDTTTVTGYDIGPLGDGSITGKEFFSIIDKIMNNYFVKIKNITLKANNLNNNKFSITNIINISSKFKQKTDISDSLLVISFTLQINLGLNNSATDVYSYHRQLFTAVTTNETLFGLNNVEYLRVLDECINELF